MDALKEPFVAAISGVKNSGKTTFLEKLVRELKRRGNKVAVIKHDGHEFESDVEGTDTFRLKSAGAYGTCIFSGSKWMAVKEEREVSVEALFSLFPEADFILIEGMKKSPYPKLELVRKAVSQKSVCDRETLLGLVTDTDLKIPGIPVFGMEDTEACVLLLENERARRFP